MSKRVENPIKEVLCNCGKTLGFVKIYDVDKRPKRDCMMYPWSMASVTELKKRPKKLIDHDEKELKTRNCDCTNFSSIPD